MAISAAMAHRHRLARTDGEEVREHWDRARCRDLAELRWRAEKKIWWRRRIALVLVSHSSGPRRSAWRCAARGREESRWARSALAPESAAGAWPAVCGV